jgi:prepilin-type N-terminal cleavage/methylation domain-containing protein
MLNKIGKKLGYKDGGFTIIEVMIVLAVAGLIMAIVLIAIPQLQRNQRNAARRDVTGRIKTEIDSFSGNNNGNIPVADAANAAGNFGSLTGASTFAGKYLTGVNINDPQTGVAVLFNVTGAIPTTPAVGTIYYRTTSVCNGEVITATGASARNYAVLMGLEGGAGYCLDNR